MNVAIFTDPDVGGHGRSRMVEAIRHAPTNIGLRIHTTATAIVDDFHVGLEPGIDPLRRFREALTAARCWGTDLVQIETSGPMALTGLYVAWRLRVPLIGYADGRLDGHARWLYRRCSILAAPSCHAREHLAAHGFARDRIAVWGCGVDLDLFSPARRSERLRERWHVSPRRPAILTVAPVMRFREFRTLCALRDRLYARGIEHALVIVAEEVEPAVREGLGDAVLTGWLSQEVLASTLASADLAVFPFAGPAGHMVLKAQAAGLPAIVRAGGDGPEYMEDAVSGAVCARDCPDEWARTAARLACDAAAQRQMRAAARQHAARNDWPLALAPVYETYRALLATAGPLPMANDGSSEEPEDSASTRPPSDTVPVQRRA